jgi:prepilin-type N-terminal cleavage/methylation domain-containing protein
MNFMKKDIKNGFTLIELLVVISIIGILAAIATASYSSAQKQARDTTRKSDMAQYRTSLEMYANKNDGLYPEYNSKRDPSSNLCTPLGLTCPGPEDPKYDGIGIYYYSYISDGTGVTGLPKATQYVLWAPLESAPSTTYWIVCSGGKSGTRLNLVPSSGVCPL